MTDQLTIPLTAASVVVPVLSGLVLQVARSERTAHRLNRICAVITAVVGLCASVKMLTSESHATSWVIADTASGIYVAVVTVVALMSALLSPAYLSGAQGEFFAARRSARSYYLMLYAFWSALVAIPVIANLGVGLLVVEATTATSSVLVAFSGKPRALEAGWKYLILTTLGMSLAFLGIVIMFIASADRGGGIGLLDWSALPGTLAHTSHGAAVAAYALVMLGLATKIGWAPVHNWLPDAHSEAPAPVSAMLSSALLPAVMLLAWRLRDAATVPLGNSAATAPLAAFGILSVAVAVPFLWQPMAWKRLLAYHSLEHMGIITVGIAIGSPLALAGVVLHFAGHAMAKALGFYAAIPLYQVQPDAARHSARDVASSSPATFAAMAVCAFTLAGLPPSPLFFSELFIILGGIEAGQVVLASSLAVLIAFAFIGLLHALLEALQSSSGQEGQLSQKAGPRRTAPILVPTLLTVAALAALSAYAWLLPTSAIVRHLSGGIS
ncbi:MAG TPA: proton-conducting transporter membrane subunit [Candidatus Dormibacteraeota bacterium]|nr:proton-conducting transporter membrane subunit [Candidatus Dormibacteraeota bacterium]